MLNLCIDTRIPFTIDGEAVDVRLLVGDIKDLMNDTSLQEEALELLSPSRREKALAIKHTRGRAQSIGAALLLNRLLNEIGLHEQDMEYVIGEHGKPDFATLISHPFSLSHSGSLAAAALVTLPAPIVGIGVGLDIQRITRYRPELVRRVFSASDRQRLATVPDEASRQRLFTQLWCHAEAYAKATGQGLQWPFPTPPIEAQFYEFDISDDYCGSLCLFKSV